MAARGERLVSTMRTRSRTHAHTHSRRKGRPSRTQSSRAARRSSVRACPAWTPTVSTDATRRPNSQRERKAKVKERKAMERAEAAYMLWKSATRPWTRESRRVSMVPELLMAMELRRLMSAGTALATTSSEAATTLVGPSWLAVCRFDQQPTTNPPTAQPLDH
jgi:hypothetical protein